MRKSIISIENQLVIIVSILLTFFAAKIGDVLYNNIKSNYKNFSLFQQPIAYITFFALYFFIITFMVAGMVWILNSLRNNK